MQRSKRRSQNRNGGATAVNYEAKITLKDGTVVRSYHETKEAAKAWIEKMNQIVTTTKKSCVQIP